MLLSDIVPPGWKPYIHPEGRPYFCYDERPGELSCSSYIEHSDQSWQYVTDADLYTEDTWLEVELLCHHLRVVIDRIRNLLPSKFQIVIYNYENTYGYYMVNVDPGSQCLFWLTEKDVTHDLEFESITSITSPAHLSA